MSRPYCGRLGAECPSPPKIRAREKEPRAGWHRHGRDKVTLIKSGPPWPSLFLTSCLTNAASAHEGGRFFRLDCPTIQNVVPPEFLPVLSEPPRRAPAAALSATPFEQLYRELENSAAELPSPRRLLSLL